MPKLKEVLSTEVHWQIADWHTRDQANIRIRQLMGDDARYFAPVYVTHAGYYWSEPDVSGWTLLTDLPAGDAAEARALIVSLRAKAIAKYPNQQQRIDSIFTRPNDDFVFVRRGADGSLDLRMTGWGFANFHRAYGGSIVDAPSDDSLRQVSLAFSIDGNRIPNREFDLWRSTSWVALATGNDGCYSLGSLAPGIKVQVRDRATGKERIETVTDDTEVIDVDVTEYLTVRVSGRHDNVPLEDVDACISYGHRRSLLTLHQGVAECRLPWLEDVECEVSLGGQSQTRVLVKDMVNVFNFESNTPKIPKTRVLVRVHADGMAVADEKVMLRTGDNTVSLVTDINGEARTEFDTPEVEGVSVVAAVRDNEASKPLGADSVVFDFNFDTPVREQFDATLLVVDMDNNPVAGYPVKVDIDSSSTEYITDDDGLVELGPVLGGDVMKVSDGNNESYTKEYTLDARQSQYVFCLPYETTSADNDCLLRVIEADGKPAAGVTCILSQNDSRTLCHLNEKGETHFDSHCFEPDKEISVSLYCARRKFPPLAFKLEEDEKEYELVEVKGPYPWWKILLEIGAVVLAFVSLFVLSAAWYGIYSSLPLIFA